MALIWICITLFSFGFAMCGLTPTAFSAEIDSEFEKLTKEIEDKGLYAYQNKDYQQAIRYLKNLLCVDSAYSFYRKRPSELSSYRDQVSRAYARLIEDYSKKLKEENLEEAQINDIKTNINKLNFELSIWENFNRGVELYQRDNIEESNSIFEATIASDSNLVEAYIFLGFIYLKQGDREKANERFTFTLKLIDEPAKKLLEAIINDILNPDTPPSVEHYPLKSTKAGKKMNLQAIVKDNKKVKSVQLYCKLFGASNFYQIPMKEIIKVPVKENVYIVEIPKELISPGKFEYYIEAIDSSDNKSEQVIYQINVLKGNRIWPFLLGGVSGVVSTGGIVFYLLTRDWPPPSPPSPPPLSLLD